jgi:hypothetical protein
MSSPVKSVKSQVKSVKSQANSVTSPLKLMTSPVKSMTSPSKLASPAVPSTEGSIKRAGKSVQHLYQVIQKSTGAVGGYGHNGPVYGEVTMGTFQKVVDALALHTGFDANSSFVDIGSGLGKPNLHVALNPGVKLSFGIELEKLRWELSMHNLRFVLDKVPEMRKSVVYFANKDATEMDNFEPFTHVYMFDVGFPPAVLVSLANAFNLSKTVQALVSFQRPDRVISLYGFAVDLVTQIQTRMSGSTELHTAYIYRAKQDSDKARPRRQLQLDTSFLVSKAGKKVSEKIQPNKKGVNVLTELQSGEYSSWVSTTGVIGAPGGRPQRAPRVIYQK